MKFMPKRRAILNPRANNKPMVLALGWDSSGSLAVTIEIKTMLSIPKMISKKVRVKSAIQASGLVKISNMVSVFEMRFL